MPTRAAWIGFRNCAVISAIGLACVWWLPLGIVECLLARCVACTGASLQYQRWSEPGFSIDGYTGLRHGIRIWVPSPMSTGKQVRAWVPVGQECTLIHLVALVGPFVVVPRTWRRIAVGLLIVCLVVSIVNVLRLRLCVIGLERGWPRFWNYDVPLYACYAVCLAFAIGYYFRRVRGIESSRAI